MNNYSPLITVLTGNNLAHSSCVVSERITTKYYFFRSQLLTKTQFLKELLQKTRVLNTSQKWDLNTALLARLKSQFLPSATVATDSGITLTHVLTGENLTKPHFLKELLEKTRVLNPSKARGLKSGVELSHITVTSHLLRKVKVKHCHTKNSATVLLVALLASCQPSYAEVGKSLFGGNSDFVEELNKINQLSLFDSFNCIDKVAVTGNNLNQELRKLLKPVQHHTLVDVFLCLSFASCLFTGELRLALAITSLWRGGHGNKPVMGEYRVPLGFSGFRTSLPPYFLEQSSKHLPFEKV